MKKFRNVSLLLIVAIFAVSVVAGCEKKGGTDTPGNEPAPTVEANTKEEVVGDKTVGIFQLTNTSLIWDGRTALETTVTNTSDSAATLKEFDIHVKDENGNDITVLKGFVGDTIEAHGTRRITSFHYANLTNAASIEYEIVD